MSRDSVIITGGAKRVGAATARYFAKNGYDIALHYNRSDKDAKKLKTELEKLGAACALFLHDLTDIKGIPPLMQKIKKEMPNVTTLINNASVFERALLMETDEALFDRQLDINFKAPFFLTQSFARVFKKGSVVNILDSGIHKTEGAYFAYMLSKKALAEFTLMAARELGPKLRVNAVCPGIMLPSSNELDRAYMKRLAKVLPLRQVAPLEKTVEAIHWLSENDALTGQLIFVDGGYHVL